MRRPTIMCKKSFQSLQCTKCLLFSALPAALYNTIIPGLDLALVSLSRLTWVEDPVLPRLLPGSQTHRGQHDDDQQVGDDLDDWWHWPSWPIYREIVKRGDFRNPSRRIHPFGYTPTDKFQDWCFLFLLSSYELLQAIISATTFPELWRSLWSFWVCRPLRIKPSSR